MADNVNTPTLPFSAFLFGPLWCAGNNFTASTFQQNAAPLDFPQLPLPPRVLALCQICPCAILITSQGNLYGGILWEHQSAKKVISGTATQLWYQ